MRSVWKGHIRFSLVTIPIQVFSAVETKGNISFKQLHKKDHGPVGYKKVCKVCDEVMSKTDIVKGYEYEPDQFAIFEKGELDNIKLKSTRAIEIEAFVDMAQVHPSRYEAVYYIGPNGDIAHDTYALFCQTLKNSGKAGIGRIILRDREDVVLLTPHEDAIVMYKLRYPHEIRDIKNVPDIQPKITSADQMKLAMTLVDSLSKDFSEIDFNDRYRDALLELVENKVAGKEIISLEDDDKETPVVDIMTALKASIDNAKLKKNTA